MRFLPTEEQVAFTEAIDDIVEGGGGADIARSWADGATSAGLALWRRFGEMGLLGLRVSEAAGGFGGTLTDLAVVFERLGYHGVPGPYLETVALLPSLVDDDTRAELAGGAIATAAVDGIAPAALDARIATHRYIVQDGALASGEIEEELTSVAPTRRLARLTQSGSAAPLEPGALAGALNEAAIAAAATLVGAGERMLDEAVSYAKVREQFGHPIGEFQALKHQLADVRIALSFARPLVWNAALRADQSDADRAVSAAKVAAGDAAMLAARTSLQVHGAIGYTAEHALRIWLGLAPALSAAWGTPEFHRARIARAILPKER
ncbi:acyl-CoA dehydrogenase family protein [Microbacterium abyssi]|uniref:acyl-CoA dehydrogenase family protein n=1 Tax=Microbacterium abyssi TaxID=2782166 RepID=UPI00188741E6|nr:acyl-CoA dehydrogenase family protein [Microbacterium sp. A18JL241]